MLYDTMQCHIIQYMRYDMKQHDTIPYCTIYRVEYHTIPYDIRFDTKSYNVIRYHTEQPQYRII